jgi:hypothetical protein
MTPSEWANLSSNVTALVAVLALIGAVWQVIVGRKTQREATASALYADYLSKAVEHPKLASACVAVPPEGEWTEEYESYEWFVAVMLQACEQIVDLTRGDAAWEKTVQAQLEYHRDYLSKCTTERAFYSDELVALFPRSRG